jgi:hypothetical protein
MDVDLTEDAAAGAKHIGTPAGVVVTFVDGISDQALGDLLRGIALMSGVESCAVVGSAFALEA